jgi:hypothetical protein
VVVSWAYNAGTNTATASGAGSTNFAALVAADTAGGWGKFTADATGTQIKIGGFIRIGDGTNTCAFADSGKQILILSGFITATFQYVIQVNANSTLTLGLLSDLTTRQTYGGCQFVSLEATYLGTYFVAGNGTGLVYVYSCSFQASILHHVTAAGGRVWNCILSNSTMLRESTNVDAYNLTVQKSASYHGIGSCTGTFDRLMITGCANAFYCSVSVGAAAFKNAVCLGNTRVASIYGTGSTDYSLTNVDADVWAFTYSATYTGKVYRQYEFDLTITDYAGNPLATATVTLKDKNNTQIFSLTTDANGQIATQTVSRGYYAQATGNTLQDYSPHTLTITKTGYIPITRIFTFTEKTKWMAAMHAQLAGDAAAADVKTSKKFYKDDADSQQTGTLDQSDATATAEDIASGKTAYNNFSNITGTYTPPTVVPRVRVVVQEKPVYIEVPTRVEKLSLRLNEVLLKEKIDRNARIKKARGA